MEEIPGVTAATSGCGTAFRLVNRNSGWVLTPLYSFAGGDDGANPEANVVIASDGSLYSTTFLGGAPCDQAMAAAPFST